MLLTYSGVTPELLKSNFCAIDIDIDIDIDIIIDIDSAFAARTDSLFSLNEFENWSKIGTKNT